MPATCPGASIISADFPFCAHLSDLVTRTTPLAVIVSSPSASRRDEAYHLVRTVASGAGRAVCRVVAEVELQPPTDGDWRAGFWADVVSVFKKAAADDVPASMAAAVAMRHWTLMDTSTPRPCVEHIVNGAAVRELCRSGVIAVCNPECVDVNGHSGAWVDVATFESALARALGAGGDSCSKRCPSFVLNRCTALV